jgi:hypothetical protein
MTDRKYNEEMMRSLLETGEYEQYGCFKAVLLPATKRDKIYGKYENTKPKYAWRVKITASAAFKDRMNRSMGGRDLPKTK